MDNKNTKKTFINQSVISLLKLLHFLVIGVLFSISWFWFRYNGLPDFAKIGFRYNYFVIIGYGVLVLFFYRTYNGYLLGYSRVKTLVFAQGMAQFFSLVIMYFLVSIGWSRFRNPLPLICVFFIQLICDTIWSCLANRLFFRLNPPKSAVLIFRNTVDRNRIGTIEERTVGRLYRIEKEIMHDGDFFEIRDQLENYDAIFVTGVNSRCRNGILKYCQENNIPGFYLPHVGDVIMQQAVHIQAFDTPIMYVNRAAQGIGYAIAKRGFDIIASLVGLIISSPILIITAVCIRLYDRGPAIYKQVRLTKDGKKFKIWKFRSMRVDAEKDGVARLSSGEKDDRITPIGRFIRKCRLDELPQLWNILRGDMSIVGPRPERPEIAEQYCQTMPEFMLRLQVKAGLTGYAQVYGKYNTDPYEKLEFDLMYIKDMSVLTDLRLMFATAAILCQSKSTEGIAAGQTTAMDNENSNEHPEGEGKSSER